MDDILAVFPDNLRVTPMHDGRMWGVDTPFRYLGAKPEVSVPVGFVTDFASVPRAFWSVFPPWDTYGDAAIVHDWLYWSQHLTRAEADAIFNAAMRDLRVPGWKRHTLYYGVRIFGWAAWSNNSKLKAQGVVRVLQVKESLEPDDGVGPEYYEKLAELLRNAPQLPPDDMSKDPDPFV